MCGRFSLTDIDSIFSRFGVIISKDINKKITPHYNIAPTQKIPVIYKDKNQEKCLNSCFTKLLTLQYLIH